MNLNRVELLATRGQTKEALDLCRPIRVRFTEQATIASDFPLHHLLAGKAALAEGRVAFKGGMFESAEEPLEAARVRFLAQVEKPSPDPEAIEGLAQTCQLLGVVLREREKRQLAEERIAEAGRHFETLRKLFPKNLQYRLNLAEVHNSSGNLHLLARAEDKAEKEYERARQLVAEVLQERPDDPWVQHRLAVIGCGLGRSLIAQKKDTGLPWLEKGVTAQDELVQKYPEIVEFTASRDMDRYSLGGVLCGLAMYDTTLSVKTLENTLALHEKGRDLLRLAALAPKPQPGALEMYAGYLEGCGAIFNVRAGDHYKAKRYPEAR